MIFDMVECSGCGNCTMACSFHHRGEFAPSRAAIKILEKEDGHGFLISFVEEDDGEKIVCIGCGECVKQCHPSEALEDLIKAFMRKRNEEGSKRCST